MEQPEKPNDGLKFSKTRAALGIGLMTIAATCDSASRLDPDFIDGIKLATTGAFTAMGAVAVLSYETFTVASRLRDQRDC